MKTFIFESPDPQELLKGINEAESLQNVCKMFGHETASFFVKNSIELKSAIEYVASMNEENIGKNDLFCFHFSCHGDRDGEGLWFGENYLTWEKFGSNLLPVFLKKEFEGKYIISISACGANEQKLTKMLTSQNKHIKDLSKPLYIFVPKKKTTSWKDSLLSWIILYHKIKNKVVKKEMMKLLTAIRNAKLPELIYFRWDEDVSKYRKFNE